MSIVIYGASDDLIEVDGDIREEFNVNTSKDRHLVGLSDGTLLDVQFDGTWRFRILLGGASVSVAQAPPNDEDNYSDRVTVESVVDWILCGSRVAYRTADSQSPSTEGHS